MVALNFDANTVEPSEALEAIPAGWYQTIISGTELKPTAKGDGSYLQLEMTIIEGQFASRKLFDRLNINNSNQVAQEIAYKTLSAICHAVGIMQLQDSAQLHGAPLEVKVSMRPAGPGADGKHYEASNETKGYRALPGGVSTSNMPPAAPSQPAPHQPPVAAQPAWQPPAQPAWQPPVQQAPAQPVRPMRYFHCANCAKVISEYDQPAACPQCTYPYLTEHQSLMAAQQAPLLQKAPPAQPAAPTFTPPAQTAAPMPNAWQPPAAPAQPAGNVAPPWAQAK